MHTFGWEKGAPGTWCTYSISIESDADHGILILHKRDLYLQYLSLRRGIAVRCMLYMAYFCCKVRCRTGRPTERDAARRGRCCTSQLSLYRGM